MFQRFTDRSRRTLVIAQKEAADLGHFIGTDHVLLALAIEGEGVAATALARLGLTTAPIRTALVERRPSRSPVSPESALASIGVDATRVRAEAERRFGEGALRMPDAEAPQFTAEAKAALEQALREALELSHDYIGTEHLLLGIIGRDDEEGAAVELLAAMGADRSAVRAEVLGILTGVATIGSSEPVKALRVDHDALVESVLRLSQSDRRHAAYLALRETSGAALQQATLRAMDADPSDVDAAFAEVPAALDAARRRLDELGLGAYVAIAAAIADHPVVAEADALQSEMGRQLAPYNGHTVGRLMFMLTACLAAAFDRLADGVDADTSMAQLGVDVASIRTELATLAD
jgi:ATP-dependent Clp protease ATP-binding subunit ClpA